MKKILIIEDENQMRKILVEKLSEAGFEVLEAEDGEKGLKMALKSNPDLVLLDLILPKMDGITLLTKLRLSDKGKELPVIVLTNLDSGEEVEECKNKGVFDYLVKTEWSLDEIVRKIRGRLKMELTV